MDRIEETTNVLKQINKFKSNNFYACLSLLLTGKIDDCFMIQNTIQKAYRHELNTSGMFSF